MFLFSIRLSRHEPDVIILMEKGFGTTNGGKQGSIGTHKYQKVVALEIF
jgi:hypothetical protein